MSTSVEEKNIYEMELHDTIGYDHVGTDGHLLKNNLIITRVPGGWVYVGGMDRSACFVPYSDEFRDDHTG